MVKSIQDIPVVHIFAGSSISWDRLLLSINSSGADLSGSSTSPGHHCLDLHLKSLLLIIPARHPSVDLREDSALPYLVFVKYVNEYYKK